MVTAQDKALATLCIERGLLDDAAVERARAAHAEAAGRGDAPPLGNLLVQGGFLPPAVAATLLRELALATFGCPKCGRTWSYEALASLARYRCDSCGERLARRGKSTRSAVPVVADATEVDPARGNRVPSGRTAAFQQGIRNTSVSQRAITLGSQRVPGAPAAGSGPAPPAVAASGPAPATGAAPRPARTLGPYEILSELGRGAMGVVYLARRPGLERLFALKVLLQGTLADAESVERFRREAALASRVQHPNVVAVHDVGVANGLYYYVMDHCPGRTLKAVLEERRKLPAEEAARLVCEIARGLGAAHAFGIVHRDVKPANVLLEAKTGTPRVTDFGLARDQRAGDTGVTRTGDIVGTPSYMAPEQLVGRRGVDARADVYALGVVLHELVSGERPFRADTTPELAAIVLTEEPRPLRSVAPDAPASLEAIVSKTLAKKPEARYPTATELASDLERFIRGEAVEARPESRLHRFWRRSWKKVAAALGVLALAGGTVALVLSRIAARDRANLVARIQEDAKSLSQRARLGEDLDELSKAFADLRAKAPEGGRTPVDLAWATALWRRGRLEAALEAAQPLFEAPGTEGLEARRIAASAFLARGEATRAAPLLAALEKSQSPALADWARTERAVVERSPLPNAVRERALRGSDEATLVALAEIDLRDANADEAAKLLDRVLGLAPDDARAHLVRAEALRGRFDLARLHADGDHEARTHVEAFFRFAGKEGERAREALYERARTELAERRFSDAARDLDAALDAGLDTADANAARALFGDDRGRACALRARELAPETADLAAELGLRDRIDLAAAVTTDVRRRLAARAAAAQAPARAALEAALLASARGEKLETALAAFDEALKLAPSCPVVALERARLLMSRGKDAKALAEVARARALPGADAGALGLVELEALARAGHRADAADAAKKLAASDRDGVPGLIARSYTGLAAEDPSAIELARHAVARAPEDATAHRFFASALLELAADAQPPEDAWTEATTALHLEGKLDLNAVFLAIASRAPNMRAMRRRRGEGRGEGRGEHGEWERMRRTIDELRAVFEDFVQEFPVAYHYAERGLISMQGPLGRRMVATNDFERARDLEPESPLGEEGLGLCSLERDDGDEDALAHWRAAKRIDPRWELPAAWESILRRAGRGDLLDKLRGSK